VGTVAFGTALISPLLPQVFYPHGAYYSNNLKTHQNALNKARGVSHNE